MAISSSNSSLRMVGRTKVVFDIDFMVERPASTLTKLAVNETRCRERVSEATCTPGRNFAIKSGVCAVLGMKMMPWTELVDNMQPPLRCPMKKGLFSGRGIGIDMQVAKMTIRPDEDVGTVVVGRGTVFDQDHAPYLCFQVTVDLVRVRVRT
ncbi:uncharacterized protein LOC117644809 [Thrips palmi]|uniref:Uncharacterized protein LOC117644809 n=1 Tax=Thrips palmi TaxID=161013 RepID=A0A6P8YKD6_THRPL|nr:uncharacterized protein LOC117644809 [Thrips palmi]